MRIEDIKKLSSIEIKAMIYDAAIEVEKLQINIRMMNGVLVDKSKEPPKKDK